MGAPYEYTIKSIQQKYQLDFVALAVIENQLVDYQIKWKYAVGDRSERLKKLILKPGKGVAGIVFKTGKSMYIENVQEEIAVTDLFTYPIIVSERLESFCALPLYRDNKVQGVALLGYRAANKMTPELYDKIKYNLEEDFPNFYRKEMAKF